MMNSCWDENLSTIWILIKMETGLFEAHQEFFCLSYKLTNTWNMFECISFRQRYSFPKIKTMTWWWGGTSSFTCKADREVSGGWERSTQQLQQAPLKDSWPCFNTVLQFIPTDFTITVNQQQQLLLLPVLALPQKEEFQDMQCNPLTI